MYITEYSALNTKEQRQLSFKRRFKQEHPEWDDSMVLLTKLVDENVRNGATVLDAGCGHGNYVIDELRKRFGRCVGIDASHEATTKNSCLDEVVIGNLEAMPFAEASFDLVVSLWVLEHVSRPDAVFQEIHRVLKPGGIFAFVTPNRASALILLRRLMPKHLAEKLVEKFHGRKEEDTFEVRYRANTKFAIRKLAAQSSFSIKTLKENFDPSYTSFGDVTYRLSSMPYSLRLPFCFPHLIGILQK